MEEIERRELNERGEVLELMRGKKKRNTGNRVNQRKDERIKKEGAEEKIKRNGWKRQMGKD